MLEEFLTANRTELVVRCRAKAAKRLPPGATPEDSEYGIPELLDQLIEIFRKQRTPEALARHKASGSGKPSLALVPSDIGTTASKRGGEMREEGLTVDQVVHGYGDLCQSVTELAIEKNFPISVDEFRTFNRCLDDAIAEAVTSYNEEPGEPLAARQMDRHIQSALLSFAAIKSGSVGPSGTTATMHEKTLIALRDLIGSAARGGGSDPDVRAIISPAAPR